MKQNKVIIIGFGPAGIACAIQLARMGLHPLVIEKTRPGGILVNANLVENYPGFPGGITGEKLVRLFEKQLAAFDIRVVRDEIRKASYISGQFELAGLRDAYSCHYLVVASGTVPVIPAECPPLLVQRGLIHTDISGLRAINGKTIGIIGAGDAAFDYALSLAENGNTVEIFNRGERIRTLQILNDKAQATAGILYHPHFRLKGLSENPEGTLEAVFQTNEETRIYLFDYLIFATGRTPATGFLDSALQEEANRLQALHRLWFIGDVKNGNVRQVSVAVGDGVRAAMEIYRHESHQQD